MLKFNQFKFLEEKLDELFKDDKFPWDANVDDQLVVFINVAYTNGLEIEEDDLKRALAVYASSHGKLFKEYGYDPEGVEMAEVPDEPSGLIVVNHADLVMSAKKVGNLASFVDAQKIFGEHNPKGLDRLDILLLEALGKGDVLSYNCGGWFKQGQGLEFLRNIAIHSIKQRHPMWFDKTGDLLDNAALIKNDSTDSFEMTEIRDLAKEVLLRREKAAKSALEKKRQRIATAKAARASVYEHLNAKFKASETFAKLVTEVTYANFEVLKDMSQGEIDVGAINTTWVPGALFNLTEVQPGEMSYFEDWLFSLVAAHHADWFVEAEDGSLKLKRNIPKEKKPGVDRITRAVKKALEKLVIKYGRDKVAEVLETVPATLSPSADSNA